MSLFSRNSNFRRVLSVLILTLFIVNITPVQAASLNLPAPTQFIPLSDSYSFPVLKGIKLNPDNPLKIDFIIDTADKDNISKQEAEQLINYFLAGLTLPEEDLWVNLSTYEKDRIMPDNLSNTDLGKNLLSQDYILKQLTASITYPESDTGKDYWDKTYQTLQKTLKTTNIAVDTFNKIWIMPDTAQIYEHKTMAVIN